TPLLSLCTTDLAEGSAVWSAFAQSFTSSSIYIISSRSWGQHSDFNLFSILHATTCTAGTGLHMLSFKQRQWLGSVFSGSSICSLHTLQIKIASSAPDGAWDT